MSKVVKMVLFTFLGAITCTCIHILFCYRYVMIFIMTRHFFFFSSGTDKKTLFYPNTCLFTILIRTSDSPSSIVLVAGFRVNINFMAYFLQNHFFIFVLKCRILVYVGAYVVSSLSLWHVSSTLLFCMFSLPRGTFVDTRNSHIMYKSRHYLNKTRSVIRIQN